MTTAASIERKLDEGALLRIWVTLCLWGRKYFCLWVFLPRSSNHIPADWMRPHTTQRGFDCVLVCMDLMECFKQSVVAAASLFSGADPRRCLRHWSDSSNQISEIRSLCLCERTCDRDFRCICKRRKAASGKWAILILCWSDISQDHIFVNFDPFISMLLDHPQGLRLCVVKHCVSEAAWIHLPRQGRLFLRNGWNEAGRGLLSRNEVDRQHHRTEW